MHTLFVRSARAISALALALASGHAIAGSSTPLFTWSSSEGGDWFDESNWTPIGVPGADEFVNADAVIATGLAWPRRIIANAHVALRDLVLDTNVSMVFFEGLTLSRDLVMPSGMFASPELVVEGEFNLYGSFAVGEKSTVWADNVTVTAPGSTLDNASTLSARTIRADAVVNSGDLTIRSYGAIETNTITNTGTLTLGKRNGLAPDGSRIVIESPGGIVNEGDIDAWVEPAEIHADMIHRGGLYGGVGLIELYGNHVFEQGSEIGRVRFRNPSEIPGTLSGATSGVISVAQGAWDIDLTIDGDFQSFSGTTALRFLSDFAAQDFTSVCTSVLAAGAFTAADVDLTCASARFEGAFTAADAQIHADTIIFDRSVTAQALEVAATEIVRFNDIVNASTIATAGPEVHFTKRLETTASASFTGGEVFLHDGYAFGGDLRISNAVATFDDGLTIGGNFGVSGVNTLIISDDAPILVGGHFLWNSPNQDIEHEIIAQNYAQITARAILAPVTATTIGIAGTTNLGADLTATSGPLRVFQADLTIGGQGDLASITLDADVLMQSGIGTTLRMEIAPTGQPGSLLNDEIHITKTAVITGMLDISIPGDADQLSLGQEFTLLTAPTIFGEFLHVALPGLRDGLRLDYFQTSTSLGVRVVPAPGAAAILGIAGLAAGRVRRRSTLAES